MGVKLTVLGVFLAAALSGCSQTAGLSQLSLLGSGGDVEPAAEKAAEADDSANGPPLPVRNDVRETKLAGAQNKESKKSGLSLPTLPDVKLFTATAYASDVSQWTQEPVAVYTQLAQQIHSCWLNPSSPKLVDHGFHAEVAPGNTSSAKIIIYKKDPNGRRGLQAFRISIDGSLTGSTVKAENRKLDKKLDLSFKSDLTRWSKGKLDCQS